MEQSFSAMGPERSEEHHHIQGACTFPETAQLQTALTLALSSLEDLVASLSGTAPCSLASLKRSFTMFPGGG